MTSNLAATAVQLKATDAMHNVQDAIGLGEKHDEEDPQHDEEKESESDSALITWEDYRKDPCLFVPITCFSISGFLGCLFVIIAFLGSSSSARDLIVGIILLIVGFGAALEIRMLGSLSDQIKFMKVIRERLEDQTKKLSGEVQLMADENAELEDNVMHFREQNSRLEENVNVFDQKNDELREIHVELEKANTVLKSDVQGLSVQNEKLGNTLIAMNEQNDRLQEGLNEFEELRGNLNMMAENAGEDMQDLIGNFMNRFSDMDNLFRDNEIVFLRQLAADVELLDDEEGLSEKEYKRFVAKLPRRYKKVVKEHNITFESMDTDGDGSIDPQELQGLVHNLLNKYEEMEEQARLQKTETSEI